MNFEKLLKTARQLPADEKKNLIEILNKDLQEKPKHWTTVGDRYILIMNTILRDTLSMYEDITVQNRESYYVWGRCIVANQLLEDGYKVTEVAKILKKDHSTISFYKHRIKDALSMPALYKRELALKDEFEKRISPRAIPLKSYLWEEWKKDNMPKYYHLFDGWYAKLTHNQQIFYEAYKNGKKTI